MKNCLAYDDWHSTAYIFRSNDKLIIWANLNFTSRKCFWKKKSAHSFVVHLLCQIENDVIASARIAHPLSVISLRIFDHLVRCVHFRLSVVINDQTVITFVGTEITFSQFVSWHSIWLGTVHVHANIFNVWIDESWIDDGRRCAVRPKTFRWRLLLCWFFTSLMEVLLQLLLRMPQYIPSFVYQNGHTWVLVIVAGMIEHRLQNSTSSIYEPVIDLKAKIEAINSKFKIDASIFTAS